MTDRPTDSGWAATMAHRWPEMTYRPAGELTEYRRFGIVLGFAGVCSLLRGENPALKCVGNEPPGN